MDLLILIREGRDIRVADLSEILTDLILIDTTHKFSFYKLIYLTKYIYWYLLILLNWDV